MIQSIRRAFDVLSHVGRAGGKPCVLGDIARAAGLNPATCSRILTTLVAAGYVEQEGARKGYRLGPMAYALTAGAPYRSELVACAELVVAALGRALRETAQVAVLQNNARFIVCQTEGDQALQVRSENLQRGEVYPTATGRLLLAHLPAAARDAFLAAVGLPDARVWPEAATRAGLLRELDALRNQKTVVTQNREQIVGVAAPIRSPSGSVTAALGVYLPASRFCASHKTEILKQIQSAASEITDRLSRLKGAVISDR